MGQLLVRNVPEMTIAALRRRAEAQGRSVEAEHRAYLNELATPSLRDFVAEAERLVAETVGRGGPAAEQTIREDRDSH